MYGCQISVHWVCKNEMIIHLVWTIQPPCSTPCRTNCEVKSENILLLLYLLSHLYRVFTIICPKKNTFRGTQCCSCSLLKLMLHVLLFPMLNVLYFYISTFGSVCVCVQCPVWLFAVVLWLCALCVCCSGTVWITLRLLQLLLLLPISLLLSHFPCTEFQL